MVNIKLKSNTELTSNFHSTPKPVKLPQVSLISSPFLFKFEEIFCSSTCAQQYAVHQLSEDTPPKHPQIEVVEDNPVDRYIFKLKTQCLIRRSFNSSSFNITLSRFELAPPM